MRTLQVEQAQRGEQLGREVIGNVAQQMLGASDDPASPAMVKIIGICAPRMAWAATRTSTFRRARESLVIRLSVRVLIRRDKGQSPVALAGDGCRHGAMVGRIILSLDCVAEGAAWLALREPAFAHALPLVGALPLRREPDGFTALLRAIVGQQVSVASAASVWTKLEAEGFSEPARMAAATDDDLRAAGLSRQKARYGRALAAAGIDFDGLRALPDAEVIGQLVAVPGIGVWTAHMFLMFSLGRADVFPHGDLGVRMALRDLYALKELPAEKEAHELARPWRPYATIASWYCWRSIDLKKAVGWASPPGQD